MRNPKNNTYTVYRIMSYDEFEKFINGEELIAYNEPGNNTSACEPTFYFATNLKDLIKLTSGSPHEVLCEFETDEELLELGFGKITTYLNYGTTTIEDEIMEYHISQYNNKIMKLANCFNFHSNSEEQHIDAINFIHKFDYESLENEYYEEQEYIEEKLEEEADMLLGNYYDEEYDDESYYDEEYDDDGFYEPDEIAEGIEPREGELREVMYNTQQLASKELSDKQNDEIDK